jgi:hypothetical protein
MLHSYILPEHDCDGELIELPEDKPTYVRFANVLPAEPSLALSRTPIG